MVPSLLLLSCESLGSVKENPDKKKIIFTKKVYRICSTGFYVRLLFTHCLKNMLIANFRDSLKLLIGFLLSLIISVHFIKFDYFRTF